MTHSINGAPVGAFDGKCICDTVWQISAKCTAKIHDREIAKLAHGKLPEVGESVTRRSWTATRFAISSTQQSEGQMYANLVDAVKMLEKMIEHTHYNCTREEAELIWRLRFVTRIEL